MEDKLTAIEEYKAQYRKGMRFTDNGFVSTTADEDFFEMMDPDMSEVEIEVPEGVRAFWFGRKEWGEGMLGDELLLERGLTFEIRGRTKEGRLKLRVIR